LAMFLTSTDTMLRYFFNHPLLGAVEVSEYMLVIVDVGLAGKVYLYNMQDLGLSRGFVSFVTS